MENAVAQIRKRLGLTQTALAEGMGVTQGNVSFYEKGQTVPPAAAARLIEFAKASGLDLTYDHVYGAVPLPGASANAPAVKGKPLGEHAAAADISLPSQGAADRFIRSIKKLKKLADRPSRGGSERG